MEETGERLLPFRVLDEDGVEVDAVGEFLHHMLADNASPSSLRSYAYELLTWLRFLRAVEVPWHVAGRAETRDFALSLKISKKPPRQRRPDAPDPGSVNPVTGKATPGENYGRLGTCGRDHGTPCQHENASCVSDAHSSG